MKNFIVIIFVLFLNNTSKAQMIKSFECVKSQKDTVLIYNLKVKFDSYIDKDERLNLVKTELEKNYQINPAKIISVETWIGKHPRTHLYTVKVKEE